jgi:Leucine-rich repeat (LRR) protein
MQLFRRVLVPLCAAGLAGCEGYSFTLNERSLYEPPRLLTDYAIEDRALADCVQQAIEDGRITEAGQLEDLNCTRAGIHSLAGLESFANLKRLGLDGNAIADLAPLAGMTQLQMLQLRDNALRGYHPVMCAAPAKTLALAGNDDFACADLERLRACGATLSDVPAPCRDDSG